MDAKMMLNQILNYYGLNINKLSSEVGQGKQTFYDINKGKIKSFSPDVAEKIINRYPNIDFIWLTTGKGEMLSEKSVIINSNVVNNVKENGNQSIDAENQKLCLENVMLKQRVEYLEKCIDQYKETMEILKSVISK